MPDDLVLLGFLYAYSWLAAAFALWCLRFPSCLEQEQVDQF